MSPGKARGAGGSRTVDRDSSNNRRGWQRRSRPGSGKLEPLEDIGQGYGPGGILDMAVASEAIAQVGPGVRGRIPRGLMHRLPRGPVLMHEAPQDFGQGSAPLP